MTEEMIKMLDNQAAPRRKNNRFPKEPTKIHEKGLVVYRAGLKGSDAGLIPTEIPGRYPGQYKRYICAVYVHETRGGTTAIKSWSSGQKRSQSKIRKIRRRNGWKP